MSNYIRAKGYQSIRTPVKEYPLIGEYPLNVKYPDKSIPQLYLGDVAYDVATPTAKRYKEIHVVQGISEFNQFKSILKPLFEPNKLVLNFDCEGLVEEADTPKYRIDNKKIFKESTRLFGTKIGKRSYSACWTSSYFCWPKEVQYVLDHPLRKKDPLINSYAIGYIFKDEDKLTELYYDGLTHLAPVTLFIGKSTKEMKEMLGKGLWSDLSNQSPNRIRLIGHALRNVLGDFKPERDAKVLKEVLSFRTGVIKRLSGVTPRHYRLDHFMVLSAKLTPRIEDFNTTQILIGDTLRMKERLDIKANVTNWSFKRFQKEHDDLVKKSNEKAIKELATKNVPFAKPLTMTIDGFTFNRLISEAEIQIEGITMGHCVGSYSSQAKRRVYEVFTVTNPNERATLGLSIFTDYDTKGNKSKYYLFNQCYQKYNKRVSFELREAVNKLTNELNMDATKYIE